MNKNLIKAVPPPALPVPPAGPMNAFASALNNVLRLFFNSVGKTLNLLVGQNGGVYIQVPNGLFFDTGDQALVAVNTAQPIRFNQTYLDNGMSINGATTSEITVFQSGIYNFQLTAQLRSGSASSKLAFLWLSRNGVDIPYSTREYNISGSGGVLELNWSFIIDMQAGDYIQFQWTGDDSDMALDASAATSPHPGMSSAVVAATFVSALPAVLPTLPSP